MQHATVLVDGIIWHRALFASAGLAKAHEGDPALAFVMVTFFIYVGLLFWAAINDD